jgi:exonuclease III
MRRRNALKKFIMMTDNVRGIKSKLNSLNDILDEEKPAVIGLTETKLREKEALGIDGYIHYKKSRSQNRKRRWRRLDSLQK